MTLVFPAHEYKGRSHSTIRTQIADNSRLHKRERADFTRMVRELNLAAPIHPTEVLRTNMSGDKTVSHMLAEAVAGMPFNAMK